MSHQFNFSLKSRKLYLNQTWVKQKGAALIFIAFILGLGAAFYVLKTYNADAARARQDEKTYKALNDAKVALIAWAVNYSSSPGQMPWPDRNSDGNYDGSSDCYIGAFDYGYLLGQLPSQPTTSPCLDPNNGLNIYSGLSTYPGLNQVFTDAQGNRLWYAVSRNLVYDYGHTENPIINPGMINPPHTITPYMRQGGTQSYPWLTVIDRNGNLVSDRVAVVIIAPGSPLENQNRSSPAPNAKEFLDSFMIGAANYKNSDSSLANEDFIMGEDSRNVPASDTTYVKPYYFNDKLVYITIDELMYALEKRALQETKSALNKYYTANGYYPFASGLGLTANQNQCVQGNLRGLLPVSAPSTHACTCTASSKTCSCNFSISSSISFTRTTGSFVATGGGVNAPIGACTVNPLTTDTCTCNGAGSCQRASGAVQFSCDACGVCAATVAGTNKFVTTGAFISPSGSCNTTSSTQVSCLNSADGSFSLGSCSVNETIKSLPSAGGLLPIWFTANQWEKYIVYAVSEDCNSTGACISTVSPPKLSVGLNKNVNAIVAGSIANPNGSCSIASYLSDVENTNVTVSNGIQDSIYQKTNPRSQTNTDQVVVVTQ
ncbi:hypothetical protein [Methylotenera versatilis]|uniref:Uncharacterized protein n=1 Tax=Methylotenera versatilis (strain 301) TaxID=666681 RepID=D7DKS7_METV0|nr:hypothetical protein [Methylotenera versatilis]ADI28538.1 conserved hypothetical protein [Methylotenera versatilis 301]